MLLSAKTHPHLTLHIVAIDLDTNKIIDNCEAVHTDEGWADVWLRDGGRLSERKRITGRFGLRDLRTGEEPKVCADFPECDGECIHAAQA